MRIKRGSIAEFTIPIVIVLMIIIITTLGILAILEGEGPMKDARNPTHSGWVDTGRDTSVFCIGWSGAASCDWEGEE